VLNSYAEGMSNTLLEAMASGLPVICTPVGGSVDLIREGEQGSFVSVGRDKELAQALVNYSVSEELRARQGTKARLRAETEFALSSMVDRYIALYREVVQT
jgi:glycosyltransferase involved in cell wall biosynthesis